MASVAADPRGLKRVCVSCGIRFYDMNKRPIACPNCNTEFTGEIKLKSRRGRAAIVEDQVADKAKKEEDDNEEEVIERDGDVVSLDDVEDMENAGSDDDDDIDLGDDDLGDLEDLEQDAEEDAKEEKDD